VKSPTVIALFAGGLAATLAVVLLDAGLLGDVAVPLAEAVARKRTAPLVDVPQPAPQDDRALALLAALREPPRVCEGPNPDTALVATVRSLADAPSERSSISPEAWLLLATTPPGELQTALAGAHDAVQAEVVASYLALGWAVCPDGSWHDADLAALAAWGRDAWEKGREAESDAIDAWLFARQPLRGTLRSRWGGLSLQELQETVRWLDYPELRVRLCPDGTAHPDDRAFLSDLARHPLGATEASTVDLFLEACTPAEP